MSKSKTNVAVVVDNSDPANPPGTIANIMYQTPSQNQVSTGFSAQTRPEDVQRLVKAQYRAAVQANIKQANSLHASAVKVRDESGKTYLESVDTCPMPDGFRDKLAALQAALTPFFKKVEMPERTVKRKNGEQGEQPDNPILVTSDQSSERINVTAVFRLKASSRNGHSSETIQVSMSEPWPKEVREAWKTHQDAVAEVSKVETRLAELRTSLTQVDQVAEEAAAAVAAWNLKSCGTEGESILKSLQKMFERRAEADGLDLNLGGIARLPELAEAPKGARQS